MKLYIITKEEKKIEDERRKKWYWRLLIWIKRKVKWGYK